MMYLLFLGVVILFDAVRCIPVESSSYWNDIAQDDLTESLKIKQNTNVAKNVILFIGDGMGITTITAARILKGQKAGGTGEEASLVFEKFPYVALSKPYNTDAQSPDSGGTATAYLTGVKTKYGLIAVDQTVTLRNCDSAKGAELTSILKWSKMAGKSTGFVTTARVTHATPSPLYAHSASRYWENDSDVPQEDRAKCKDIADQLLANKDIEVVMGGGRRNFIPKNESDPEYARSMGKRSDGRNLINEWIEAKNNANFKYVWNLTDFNSVMPDNTDFLLGLFEPSHMQYSVDRLSDGAGEPTLAQMVEKALKILRKNNKGYFLLVEGGRIDHAHHDSNAAKALEDTLAFDEAVNKALALTDDKDTLIITTADHSHVFTIGGYAKRGNPILGAVETVDLEYGIPADGMPYTVLAYGNGPGFNHSASRFGRENLTNVNTADFSYIQQSAVNIEYETHGAEDVSIYASGPMAHLFHGVHEQNYIAHVMAYASCVGANKNHCKKEPQPNGGNLVQGSSIFCIIILLRSLKHII